MHLASPDTYIKNAMQTSFTQVCPCDNSWPIQARFTKFEPEVQNNLVKIPIGLGMVDLDLQGQI